MAEKNFKIQNGLDLNQGQVINLGGGALGSGPNPEYPLQWIGNNVATELFVNNALTNINTAQFIESVQIGSPLKVEAGQLSLTLDIGGLSIITKDIGGSNALVVNPQLTAMDSITFNGGLLSLSNTGAINTSSVYFKAPNGNTSTAYFTAQTDSELTLAAGTLNTGDLRVGFDSFTSNLGSGTLTVAGDATINGNLTVNGTTTTINTENLLVEDNMVTLNSNVGPGNVAAAVSSGIEVLRGDSPTVSLYWDEMFQGWYINNGNTSSQLGASFINSVATPFSVTSGELSLSLGNGLMVDSMMGMLTIDPQDAVYTSSQTANVYTESSTMAVVLSSANTNTTVGTFAPAATVRGSATALRSFEAHVTLVTPTGATRTSKLVGVNNAGTIDYNEYAIVEDATSGFGADITVVDGTATGGQITIEAAHGTAGTVAIAHWTAISN